MSTLPRTPCPHCGEMNLTTDSTCLACGKTLRPAARPRTLKGLGLPAVSGVGSVVLLALCFAVSAILIPVAAHLPRWVEVELVLAAWWATWIVVLATLLYRGHTVSDDASAPRWGRKGGNGSDLSSAGDGCFWFGDASCLGGDVFVGLAILIALIVGLWLLFEFILPALAFLLYLMIHRMLAVVVNAPRICRGSLSRAMGWAVLWASVYTAPLGLLVWLVHAVEHRLH